MYNGIGLQTARGSGTNGYIQSNKFFIRPRPSSFTTPSPFSDDAASAAAGDGATRKPNKDILEHDRKRHMQLQLLLLEEELQGQGYTEEEISHSIDQARSSLLAEEEAEAEAAAASKRAMPPPPPKFSDTETHQIAARKEKKLEVFRAALGIQLEDEISGHETKEQKEQGKTSELGAEKSDDEEPGEIRTVKKNDSQEKYEIGKEPTRNQMLDSPDSGSVEDHKEKSGRRKMQSYRKSSGRHGISYSYADIGRKDGIKGKNDESRSGFDCELNNGRKEMKRHESYSRVQNDYFSNNENLKIKKTKNAETDDHYESENGKKHVKKSNAEKRRRHDTDSDSCGSDYGIVKKVNKRKKNKREVPESTTDESESSGSEYSSDSSSDQPRDSSKMKKVVRKNGGKSVSGSDKKNVIEEVKSGRVTDERRSRKDIYDDSRNPGRNNLGKEMDGYKIQEAQMTMEAAKRGHSDVSRHHRVTMGGKQDEKQSYARELKEFDATKKRARDITDEYHAEKKRRHEDRRSDSDYDDRKKGNKKLEERHHDHHRSEEAEKNKNSGPNEQHGCKETKAKGQQDHSRTHLNHDSSKRRYEDLQYHKDRYVGRYGEDTGQHRDRYVGRYGEDTGERRRQ